MASGEIVAAWAWASSYASLAREGIDVAYYLIHTMGSGEEDLIAQTIAGPEYAVRNGLRPE